MRSAHLCGLALVLAGCAAKGVPPPQATADKQHNACAARMVSARMVSARMVSARMVSARMRGLVHWPIYEHCIKEHA